MATTFYFYDLETSGFNPRSARIMQFAGQRTDLELQPIGEPHNFLIKLTDDILPDPDAVLVTGITPQATRADGLTEVEFLKIFHQEVSTPNTIFVGFNSIRFDDEFMRFLNYRNFYDAYEWQWQDGRSRWDLLDVVRMTRALRPEGLNWPFDSEGKPSNRLTLLTGINKLEHAHAHDALSDVFATIEVARLVQAKQAKLFEYLLGMRDKQKIAQLANSKQPFVYTSGKYPSEYEKTTVVIKIADHPKDQAVLVFDLRHDPTPFINLSPAQIAEAWRWKPALPAGRPDKTERFPVKTLKFNRCPAVAPMGVMDEAAQKRLSIDMKAIKTNLKTLSTNQEFVKNVLKAVEILNKEQQTRFISDAIDVDAQLYDNFLPNEDKTTIRAIRAAQPSEISDFKQKLKDIRLQSLIPLYKARNFPKALNEEEHKTWEAYRIRKLTSGGQKSQLASYFNRLQQLAGTAHLTDHQRYLLEELQLYGQSIMPEAEG